LEVANLRLLLKGGAKADAVDDEGQTAFEIALIEGYDEIAQLLSEHDVEKKP
jgi:ankyrin repeat protein